MTNFTILYASAAVLMLSALVTLGVVAIWALGELRPGEATQFRVVGFTGASDEPLAFETPALTQDVAA